jgi:hydrogenase maturation protease
MTRSGLPRIGVLGLGNLMRTDDAVGMLVLPELARKLPREIQVIEGGTLGLDLLDAIFGISRLLVLDAVDTGAAPGTLVRFAGDDLARLPTSKSVHLLGLSDLMQVLLLMDACPTEVILLGVQPGCTGWGTALTPAVAAAQPRLAESALRQLANWCGNLAEPSPAQAYA